MYPTAFSAACMMPAVLSRFLSCLRLYAVGAWLLLLQLLRTKQLQKKRCEPCHGTAAIVSGVTSGVGRALCTQLAAAGVRVIALASLDGEPPACAYSVVRSDFRDVYKLHHTAALVRSQLILLPPRHRQHVVVVHAAGAMTLNKPNESYAVNLTAPAILSSFLIDLVHCTVFLGSASHSAAPYPIQPLLRPPSEPRLAYPCAKLLLLAFADALSIQTRMPAIVVHPGVVNTALYKSEPGVIGVLLRILLRQIAWHPTTSAQRVFQVIRQARTIAEASKHASRMEYWDATTLQRESLPPQIRAHNGSVCTNVSEQIWHQVQALVAQINAVHTSKK